MDLFAAIQAGDVEAARSLLHDDPTLVAIHDDAGLSAVLAAQYRHQHDIVDLLLAADPPLDVFDAAAVGAGRRLTELLDADPSLVNSYAADGFFPLALAAHFGQPAAVQLLLDRGADVSQAAANPMMVRPCTRRWRVATTPPSRCSSRRAPTPTSSSTAGGRR